MATAKNQQRRRRLPLSARLSLLVLFAAVLPLAAVVGINDTFARATLEQQGRTSLTTDAQAKVALVQEYLHERVLDGQALSTLPTAPAFLVCAEFSALPPSQTVKLAPIALQLNCATQLSVLYEPSNCRGLKVGVNRDTNYTTWALYDARGDSLLSSAAESPDETQCQVAVPSTAPAAAVQQVVQNATSWISPVYSDALRQNTFIDIYTPITLAPLTQNKNQTIVGFMRSTLNLNYIDGLMKGESGANGSGSYAFITDANGIRIADTNQSELFSSVLPLDAATQQQIASDKRFGNLTQIPQDSLPAVAGSLQSAANPDSFQSPAAPGSSVQYQFVRVHIQLTDPANNNPISLGWSYFVLSPISTVTAVANNQVETSLIIAGIIAVLAILIGLLIGRAIARPVHAATADLEGAAGSLQLLAARQQGAAGEQQWVVDACKTGLDSVRYLADAMNQAARRIIDASNWFSEYWDRLTEEQARRTVQHLLELARYIDEAARRQQASNERLGKAITVTDQVSDQLVTGAAAASKSAEQLEQVVSNLQRVVGGRPRGQAQQAMAEQGDLFAPMAAPAPAPSNGQRAAQSMRMDGPSGNRAPRAPQAPWNANQPSQTFDNGYGNNDGYDGYGNYGGNYGGGPSNPYGGYTGQPAPRGLPAPNSMRQQQGGEW
jgi:methyl-accepting chemotaxis protein